MLWINGSPVNISNYFQLSEIQRHRQKTCSELQVLHFFIFYLRRVPKPVLRNWGMNTNNRLNEMSIARLYKEIKKKMSLIQKEQDSLDQHLFFNAVPFPLRSLAQSSLPVIDTYRTYLEQFF